MTTKVVVTDGIDAEGLEPIANRNGFNIHFVEDAAKLSKELEDADALLVRSKTKVTAQLLEGAKKLKFVGRAGVGVDNIDLNAATRRGIVVANAPGANTISAAEHTFALLLTLSRNVSQSDASVKSGLWKREKFIGSELLGKTLGLLGFGRIGKEVAARAIAFGMKVIAYDPFVSESHIKSLEVHPMSLENVLKNSDYISLHLPATEKTKNIINAKSLSLMKPDARLINCARGDLIDENALIEALEKKKIKGAALDVFKSEPLQNEALRKLENVILTPHLGASTEEAQAKVAIEVSLAVRDYFEKGLVKNAVNLPSLDPEVLEKISPYLALSEKLGKFISQISEGGLKEVKVEFFGDFSSTMRNILKLSVLRGILSTALKEEVNWVNAEPIAMERGIRLQETAVSEAEDFTSLITVKIKTDTGNRSVSGTILTRGTPRIARIDELPVDVIPQGNLLIYTNIDRPGVIGFIGTLLGKNQINIAAFQVGRKSLGGEAVSILNVDSEISKDILKEIKQFSGITNVWTVSL